MFPKNPIEIHSYLDLASFILLTSFYKSVIFYLTHPCLILLSKADSIT